MSTHDEDTFPETAEIPESDDDSNGSCHDVVIKIHPLPQEEETPPLPQEEEKIPSPQKTEPPPHVVSPPRKNRRLTISVTPPNYPVSMISTTPAPPKYLGDSPGIFSKVAPSPPGVFGRGISMQTVFMAATPFKPSLPPTAEPHHHHDDPTPSSWARCCRKGGCCPMVVC